MSRSRTVHKITASTFAILWSSACLASGASLKKDIESVLAEENLIGIAWALVEENGDVTVDAAGLRDNASGTAFARETRFHVGSLAKTVLASGILNLATEGRIDLDAPALDYLPGLFTDGAAAGFSDVTVRHLLDHTAGLNDAHMWQMFSEHADPDAELTAAFPDPKTQLKPRSQPGARFSYSNMGYTLLGMIVESVVGARYETYLDEHLLAPLDMHDSTFAFTTQEGKHADATLAWGHVDDGSRYAATPIFLRPAGQFTSTATDLARFAKFLMSDGVIDGRPLIDESLQRSLGRPHGTKAAREGLIAGYALGLGRRDRHGVVGYCHGGNIVGFVARLCVFPDEHKAFAYSVNTDSETADYGRLDSMLVGALGITAAQPSPTSTPAADMPEWYGLYVLSPNRFHMFEYLDTVFGAVDISERNGSLTLTSLQQGTRVLRPVGDRLYSASDRTSTSHAFFRGSHGEYLFSDGFRTYRRVPTAYLAAHWTSLLLGFAGSAWLLVAGGLSLLRYRAGMLRRVEAPAFVSLMLLPVPIPLFASQSFMALGDLTLASALLAIVTLLLPVGMLLTCLRARDRCRSSLVTTLHGAAAILVLQWCIVLVAAGLLPFRLWA